MISIRQIGKNDQFNNVGINCNHIIIKITI